MKVLSLLVLLSAAANAQYGQRVGAQATIHQSLLSQQSPRAGPDPRVRPAPLAALEGLRAGPSQLHSPYAHSQFVGSDSGGVGSGAYALTVNGGQLLSESRPQGSQGDGGYAVAEPSQEHQHAQIPQGYQLLPQRVAIPSSIKKPQAIHQFQYPIQQQFQNLQPQQPLFIPRSSQQPQQFLQERQSAPSPPLSSNSPVNFPQPQEQDQPQPGYTLQQQFYEQEPQIRYIQRNPSVSVTNPSPAPPVSLPAVNSPSYRISGLPTAAGAGSLSTPISGAGHGNAVSYGIAPSTYGGSQQYYSLPLNDINALKQQQEPIQYTSGSPIRSLYRSQAHLQSSTARPLTDVARALPVAYQQQIPQTRYKDTVSQGIYNPYTQPANNIGTFGTIGALGKEESSHLAPQQLRILAFAPQQPIAGSYASGAPYGAQNAVLRNPVDYASPFARQELLQLRQRGPAESREQLSQQIQPVRNFNEEADYDSDSESDENKKTNSFGPEYSLEYYL